MEKNYMCKGEKESLEKFNSITHKVKPENQNQTHNVRKEGVGPSNQLR
ncbi:MAG: hypothetical protein IKL07_08865 [Clostridium sp.]|nr:hypothetical protein [Clostridium sp.]